MRYKLLFLAILIIGITTKAESQIVIPITFEEYLSRVSRYNNLLISEKFNVDIAEANILASKVFSDPSISFGYSSADINNFKMGQGVNVELAKEISFGKRGASISIAESEHTLSRAILDQYYCNLRAEATLLWLDAIRLNRIYKAKLSTYEMVRNLVSSDSVKLKKGVINETDLMQSIVEAGIMHNDLLLSKSELDNAYIKLTHICSIYAKDSIIKPSTQVLRFKTDIELSSLIEIAQKNRKDLYASAINENLANLQLKNTKVNLRPDVEFVFGVNFLAEATNEMAPSPRHRDVYLGVNIPLNFSKHLNRGEIKKSEIGVQQAKVNTIAAKQRVEQEVIEAYNTYKSYDQQLKAYSGGLLIKAENVLKIKKRGYELDEVPFLEVLDAQRTYDDILLSYYETLYLRSSSLVNLQRAVGVWSVK